MSDLPRHRGGECHHCEGIGRLGDKSRWKGRGYRGPTCDACEGHGDILWDWYCDHSDAECTECKTEGLDVAGYGEDGEEGYVCRPCYIKWHTKHCGCDAWPKATT